MQNLKPHIRRVGAFVKSHALTLLSTFALAAAVAYIAAVCSCDVAISVGVNGTDYGYIDSANTVIQATTVVGNEIYKASGGEYTPDINISYDMDLVMGKKNLTGTQIADILWSYCREDFCEAYMLYVDDVRAAAYESGDELYLLLDEIEAEILDSVSEGFSNVKFSNRLRIEKQLCEKSMLKSLTEINELLNPLFEEQRIALEASYAANTVKEGIRRGITSFSATSPLLSEVPMVMVDASKVSGSETDLVLDYSFANTYTSVEPLAFRTVYIADNEGYIGTEKVMTAGVDGTKEVTYEILYDTEGNVIGHNVLSETVITKAVDEIIAVGTLEKPECEPTGRFIWPCEAPKGVSSYYGWRDLYGKADFHLGIDIPDSKGSSIWAADGGEVIWAGHTPSYGLSVKIQHGNKTTVYAHLDDVFVKVGDKVFQGQEIGTMGDTGVAYGIHLHFEIRINNVTVDPMNYLP